MDANKPSFTCGQYNRQTDNPLSGVLNIPPQIRNERNRRLHQQIELNRGTSQQSACAIVDPRQVLCQDGTKLLIDHNAIPARQTTMKPVRARLDFGTESMACRERQPPPAVLADGMEYPIGLKAKNIRVIRKDRWQDSDV